MYPGLKHTTTPLQEQLRAEVRLTMEEFKRMPDFSTRGYDERGYLDANSAGHCANICCNLICTHPDPHPDTPTLYSGLLQILFDKPLGCGTADPQCQRLSNVHDINSAIRTA